jgi:hypothetical protein
MRLSKIHIKLSKLVLALCLVIAAGQASGQEIWSYRKVSDSVTTYDLKLSTDAKAYELATIDGITYVAVDSATKIVSSQLSAVSATLKKEMVDSALIDKIKAQSPHYELLRKRVEQYISSLSIIDARYFMLSFYEEDLNAKIAALNLEKPPVNTKAALTESLKEKPETLLSEIAAWEQKQMKDFGFGSEIIGEVVK